MSSPTMTTHPARSPHVWLAAHGRDVLLAPDAMVGLAAGVGAGVAVGFSKSIGKEAVTILLAEAAVGVALAAVVLAALAIFATFFDDSYRQVLEAASDRNSVRDATFPYEVVAALAGLSTIAGLLVALVWPALPPVGEIIGLGLATGLSIWAVAGSIQLVGLTAWHAEQRATLMRALGDAKSQLAERRKRKHPA